MTRLLAAAYLVEAGLLLLVGPWTLLWDRNYFAAVWPHVDAWFANPYVRGAVSGIGVVTFAAGVRDLVSAIAARQADRDAAARTPAPPLP